MPPDWVLRHGRAGPPPQQIALRAGPLALTYETGTLRYIRLGEREVLRQVYVALRDPVWDTVPAVISDLAVEAGADRFEVRFTACHQRDEIDFCWRGTITGDARGSIRFVMDGRANRTFKRNRIGFCVLHPLESAGAPVEILKLDGSRERRTFPREVSPYQPFMDLRAMTHEVAPGLWAEVVFEGETFETEDHRNWTDASFKTYSTPLRLPVPVEVRAGEQIVQVVTLSLRGTVRAVGARPTALTVAVGGAPVAPLPRIGLGRASHGRSLAPGELVRLQALGLTHLRIDLPLAAPDLEERLRQAVDEARALGVSLEAALFLSDAAREELWRLERALRELRPPVSTWLVFHVGELSTAAKWVELARPVLTGCAPGAKVGAGSNAYFTELNRSHPPVASVDLVCYSLNPQVHAFDDATLVENLAAQKVTVESARRFVGDRLLAVSPVTLRPRGSPNGAGPAPEPRPGQLPSTVDVRQMSLFGAGWTMGSVKYLAEAGVYSVTYYETTGWRGVMETAEGPPLPDKFPSRPGTVFPLYHVLADVGEVAEGAVVPACSSDPLRVEALALRKRGRTRVLVANLTGEPQAVTVSGLPALVWVRHLDERTAEPAMREPEAFRREKGEEVKTAGSRLEIELAPCALATVDQPAH